MSKIMNIGMLDVREIEEEIANEISSIENIGVFIESDESKKLLKHVKKQNIGTSLNIPLNKDLKIVTNNGRMKIDREYLEGIDGAMVILINGELRFMDDVSSQLINEKIYSIMLNGRLICPKSISGMISSKATINGSTVVYKSGYIFFPGAVELSNRFLKGFKEKSKISLEKLIIKEALDPELLESKLDHIEVVDKLISLEKYEDDIYPFIDEYYSVKKEIIPCDAKGMVYIKGDTKLDRRDIEKYDEMALYIDGDLEINLNEDMDFSKHIVYLICDKLVLNDMTYTKIRRQIAKNVEVEIVSGKLLVNKGKMMISEDLDEMVTIKNMGKLEFGENMDNENLDKYIYSIDNYGVIACPPKLMGIVNKKTVKNYGKIKNYEKISEPSKAEKDKEKEGIMYSNMGELKL